MHRSVIAAAFAIAVSGAALSLITNPAMASPHPWQGPPISMIAGRIAFLKAELGITPAEESLWKPVAAAMRQSAGERQQLRREFHDAYAGKTPNAIERLDLRLKGAKAHADDLSRFATAFKPLYASLSPKQKHIADVLFSRFGQRHQYRGGR